MYQYCMNITVLFTSKDFVSQNPRGSNITLSSIVTKDLLALNESHITKS